jgi:glycosyltransferase involved in cell wall biosynthesis
LEGCYILKYFQKNLLRLYQSINKSVKDLGVHVIGDGPAKAELVAYIQEYKTSNIMLHGEVYGEDVCKYLYISDLLVNPGYLGLSIVHSFCFGTPVVSFQEGHNGPYHSPEAEYIEDEITGFLAKNKDLNSLTSFIVKYLNDNIMQERMKINTLKYDISKIF